MRKPELAHKEVVKFEAQFGTDVGIGPLFVRQADIEPYAAAPCIGRATARGVHNSAAPAPSPDTWPRAAADALARRFHNAAAAARAHDIALRAGRQALRPQRQAPRQFARLVVVAAERPVLRETRGAEEDNRVVYVRVAKTLQR